MNILQGNNCAIQSACQGHSCALRAQLCFSNKHYVIVQGNECVLPIRVKLLISSNQDTIVPLYMQRAQLCHCIQPIHVKGAQMCRVITTINIQLFNLSIIANIRYQIHSTNLQSSWCNKTEGLCTTMCINVQFFRVQLQSLKFFSSNNYNDIQGVP